MQGKSRSQGKRHTHATTTQLTKILIFLRSEKKAILTHIQMKAIIPSNYVSPALHWLVSNKLVRKFKEGGRTFYSLEKRNIIKKGGNTKK